MLLPTAGRDVLLVTHPAYPAAAGDIARQAGGPGLASSQEGGGRGRRAGGEQKGQRRYRE